MRAVFGIVALLLVLAVVSLLVTRQLGSVRGGHALPASASGAVSTESAAQQARQVQQQVRDDVQKALEQATRRNSPDE